MKLLIKILLSTLAVLLIGYLLDAVTIDNIQSAAIVAIVLGLLNTFVKPILVFLTIPVTILTLGLFLLVINAGMIMLADRIVDGFRVDGFLMALIFSVLLSITQSILYALFVPKKKKG